MDATPPFQKASNYAVTLLGEFKAFAFKGNVIDLAIGVVIGTAFSKIVDSLVKNLIMPLISLIPAFDRGYQDWARTVGTGPDARVIPYGLFLADVLNFLIIALALFLFVVKFLKPLLRSRAQEESVAVAALTKDQELLTEIRDLLRTRGEAAR